MNFYTGSEGKYEKYAHGKNTVLSSRRTVTPFNLSKLTTLFNIVIVKLSRSTQVQSMDLHNNGGYEKNTLLLKAKCNPLQDIIIVSFVQYCGCKIESHYWKTARTSKGFR
ncbi:hypothetical protein CEXT_229611 [Caerostris extrusa]|uniref:Uncharacterized protein n=1 Tax=Caerostris extrusa TaxID=172846 RepID=A0AAV4SZP6_CAEEX|nr:hypothetical protein CEXT_229611 [Caerostris extrusa]